MIKKYIDIIRNIISKNEKDQIEIAPGPEQPRPDVSGSGRSYKWEWCDAKGFHIRECGYAFLFEQC